MPGCSNRQAIEQAESFAARVCACADSDCARKTLAEFESWFAENSPRGSRDDAEAVTAAYRKAEGCASEREEQP